MPTETNLSFTTLLAWPAALFLLLAPGFATLLLILSFAKNRPSARALNRAEQIFWTLALSLCFDAWLSFTLAEFGLFSLAAVLALAALYSLPIFFLQRANLRFTIYDLRLRISIQNSKFKIQNSKLDGFVLVALLLGALALNYFALHETVVGAQDSGVYTNTGANIARTGAILIKDPLLPALDAAGSKTQPQFLLGMPGRPDRFLFVSQQRLPGFFVKDKAEGLAKGEVIPQLFHLYPALLALGMSLFGLWGGLWITPLLGVLAVFALYLTVRRLFPAWRERWIAPLAALFLMLNAVQVWFSRETLWEVLGEFLVFTAIYAFTLMVRPVPLETAETSAASEPERDEGAARLGGFGVGLALGLICLAHAQFPFMVWPLLPYFIWMRLTRRWGAPQWFMLAAFGLLALHTTIHIRLFSLAYFEGVYHNVINDLRNALHILLPAAAIGFLLLILLDAIPKRIQAFSAWVRRRWRIVSFGLAAIVTAYMFYSYFIRVYDVSTDGQGNVFEKYWSLASYIGAPSTEGPERNLLRLGWYFSPPGMLLAFLGLAAILVNRLNARTGFFLALTLGVTFIFLDYNYTQEQYIYSMRRYITATIPAFSIFAAYACLETLPRVLEKFKVQSSRFKVSSSKFQVQSFKFHPQGNPAGRGSNSELKASNVGLQISTFEFAAPNIQPSAPLTETEPETQNSKLKTQNSKLKTQNSKLFGLVFAAGIVVFLIWTGRTVFSMREYGPGAQSPGVVEQVRQLAGQFGPKDILIFAGERDQDAKLATPLTYAFGIPSFDLAYAVKNDELGDLLRRWEGQGYHLKALLGPNGGRMSPTGYTLKQTGETTIVFNQLQQLRNQKPNNPQTNTLTYGIYDVVGGKESGVSFGTGRVDSKEGWTLQIGKSDWPALVYGFYSAERDPDGLLYRWTETDGQLRVPCLAPDGGAGKLTLMMGAGTRPVNLPPLSVKVYLSYNPYDEPTYRDPKRLQPLATLTLKPGVQDYTVDLPAGQDKLTCGQRASSLILWLTVDATQTWVPQQQKLGDDVRRLAIKLAGVNLVSVK